MARGAGRRQRGHYRTPSTAVVSSGCDSSRCVFDYGFPYILRRAHKYKAFMREGDPAVGILGVLTPGGVSR